MDLNIIDLKREDKVEINQSEDMKMKKEMDKIQFDSQVELQELMKVIDKYVKQNPKEKQNEILERFFDLLDIMDMEW